MASIQVANGDSPHSPHGPWGPRESFRVLRSSRIHQRAPTYIKHGTEFIEWDSYSGNTIDSAAGNRDVILIISNVLQSDTVIPRKEGGPLTQEEEKMLLDQGVRKDCLQSDLHIMMMRYILSRQTSIYKIISGEDITAEDFRKQLEVLLKDTTKAGVVLHYIGPGQKGTGNWCFSDGFVTFGEIKMLYSQFFEGRVLSIVSDCSYSGRWVKEAMSFMDNQGVGPCGHLANEKGILVKVYASCQENEVPTELAFSTHSITNDKETGNIIFKIHLQSAKMDNQDPSGLDFTGIRCSELISQPCALPTGAKSTWKNWSDSERVIHVRMALSDGGKPEAMCEFLVLCRYDDIAQALEQFKQELKDGTVQMPSLRDGSNPSNEVVRGNVIVNYMYSYGHL